MRALLREPAAHFALLGIALFALHAWVAPDDRAVVVTAQTVAAKRRALTDQLGQEPTADQLRAELDRYVDEEVLRREAIALGLEREDVIVRRRLVQKMSYLLEELHPPPEPTEAELEAWLASHRDRYQIAPRFSFEHVFFAHTTDTGAVLEALRAGAPAADFGEAFVHGRQLQSRSTTDLSRMFGAEFTTSLAGIPLDTWTGPVPSDLGIHLVRVREHTVGQAPTLAAVRGQITADWRQQATEAARAAALQDLRRRYEIRYPETLR